jgi:hypothetical protein
MMLVRMGRAAEAVQWLKEAAQTGGAVPRREMK